MTDVEALDIILRSDVICRYRLQVEVLSHYLDYRRQGDQPNEALGCAMWDWDVG